MAATAASYTLDLHAPTLFGSYVIDSVLTKKGISHETYFVEGVGHEFYDEDAYTAKVQEKVFNFLYSMTQSTTGIKTFVASRPSLVRMGEKNMNFTVSGSKTLRYRVVDLRGRAVFSGNVSPEEVVDLSSLEKGVYVLQVSGEKPLRFSIVY
jgi:hypothetical protein